MKLQIEKNLKKKTLFDEEDVKTNVDIITTTNDAKLRRSIQFLEMDYVNRLMSHHDKLNLLWSAKHG